MVALQTKRKTNLFQCKPNNQHSNYALNGRIVTYSLSEKNELANKNAIRKLSKKNKQSIYRMC